MFLCFNLVFNVAVHNSRTRAARWMRATAAKYEEVAGMQEFRSSSISAAAGASVLEPGVRPGVKVGGGRVRQNNRFHFPKPTKGTTNPKRLVLRQREKKCDTTHLQAAGWQAHSCRS